MDEATWIQIILVTTQTAITTITLIVLILQTRQFIKQTDALIKNLEISSIEMATNKMYKIYEILINKPHLCVTMGREYTTETAYVSLLIDLYAMIYEQYQRGLINEIDWKGWENAIRINFKSDIFRNEWKIAKITLPEYFVKAIEERIYQENRIEFMEEEEQEKGKEFKKSDIEFTEIAQKEPVKGARPLGGGLSE